MGRWPQTHVDQLFELLATGIERTLGAGSVRREADAHAEAFGFRYRVFRVDADRYRLVWDGRDRRFLLQRGVAAVTDEWLDLVGVPVDELRYPDAVGGVEAQVMEALEHSRGEAGR